MSAIPKGFKKTEVGVIPEEWEVIYIRDLAVILTGPFGTLLKANEYSKQNNGVPVISVGEIKQGYILVNDGTPFVDYSVTKRLPQYVLSMRNIVFARKGGVDRSAVITSKEAGWFLGSDGIALTLKNNVSSKYLGYQFSSNRVKQALLQSAIGTTMPSLNQEIIGSLCVSLPPLPEQKRIAQVLGDVDALIQKLEELIVKKRDIKQASMQELLTGKRRLPGFTGKWETKKLGEIFEISTGKTKSAYINNGGVFFICDMGSVSIDGKLVLSKRTDVEQDLLKIGDLVMPKDDIGGGNIIGKVGYVKYSDTCVLGDHVYRLRSSKEISRFFSYLINSYVINSSLRKKVIGSAQLGLSRSSVVEQEVSFPGLPEQSAIAQVLSDMDSELSRIETRLTKTRDLKSALMQQLLTGRIRLEAS
jgi:type I restriction enzyme, S subunit